MRIPGEGVKRTRLIQSEKYVLAIEVEMVIPVDDPGEPCYESETVQLLKEINEHADNEDLDWLKARGKVYAGIEAVGRNCADHPPKANKEHTMNLTREQLEQAKRGQPVEIAEKGDEFILIRKDLYDRGRRVIDDWDPRDGYPLVNQAMREDDASDPLLDSEVGSAARTDGENYRP